MDATNVNCQVACVNGCILGENCPNKEYVQSTTSFITNTSLDELLNMAEEAVMKKRLERASEPPKWVIPDFP